MLSYITMGKENHNPNAAPALAAPALQQRQAVAAPGDVIIIDVDSDSLQAVALFYYERTFFLIDLEPGAHLLESWNDCFISLNVIHIDIVNRK